MGINYKAKAIEFKEKNDGDRIKRFLNGNFYERGSNVWHLKEYADVIDEIARFAMDNPDFLEDCREHTIKSIAYALKAYCKHSNQEPNTFFGEVASSNIFYIPLRNIILKFTLVDSDERVRIEQIDHTPDFFNTYILPYDYIPDAKAPRFNSFIDSIQPEDIKNVILEWFGLNLTPVMVAQKFVIYYGLGANGKGILTGIQRDLCGESNCSSLSLEEICGTDKYKKAELENKTSNITDEIEDVKASRASALKVIVGGGRLMVERKYQAPYKANFFCKFTYSSNVLVRFKDPSNAIYRRLIIIPFEKQFLNEKEQNKELLKSEYWRDELPGIFNLSLEGLLRLIKSNWNFTESEKIKHLLEAYVTATSPETSFLKDYTEEAGASTEIIKIELYQAYQRYCQLMGARYLSEEQFGIYVRKLFPRVQSTNPLNRKGGRFRCWTGIRFIKNDQVTDGITAQATHADLKIAPLSIFEREEVFCAEE